MNEDLTQDLKAAYYKFARFSEDAGTKSGMVKAFEVVAKFFMGMQMEDPETPTRVDAMTQIEGIDGGHMVP